MPKLPLAIPLFAASFVLGAADPKPEVLVFAAASLTESLQSLGKVWETGTGRKVTFSFGSSSDLARQIEAGAPADVFFSADTARMDALEKAGFVRGADRREFLSNTLVVVVPSSSNRTVGSPPDLGAFPRIALADPTSVPAGIYARRWLTSLGLWERLEPKIVPTLDVRAALAAVDSGAVAAAIVYRTDAAVAGSSRIAYEVRDGPEILYSVAPVSRSKNHAAAEAFVAFLAGDTGLAEFRRSGFLVRDKK